MRAREEPPPSHSSVPLGDCNHSRPHGRSETSHPGNSLAPTREEVQQHGDRRLGTGSANVRSRIPAVLSFAAAILLATVAGILVVEGYLLATDQTPITWYVRCAVSTFPGWAMLSGCGVSAGVGALLAHFLWDKDQR